MPKDFYTHYLVILPTTPLGKLALLSPYYKGEGEAQRQSGMAKFIIEFLEETFEFKMTVHSFIFYTKPVPKTRNRLRRAESRRTKNSTEINASI